MPIPTIDPASSVAGFKQYESFSIKLAAFHTPTSWSIILPTFVVGDTSELTKNETTGEIYGHIDRPGTFNIPVTATNASGTSPQVNFFIGIRASPGAPNTSAAELYWDVTTGVVTATDPAAANAPVIRPPSGLETESSEVVFQTKLSDARLFHIYLRKGSNPVDLTLESLAWSTKLLDYERELVTSISWQKIGSGPATYYRMLVEFTSPQLATELASAESDTGTRILAINELQLTHAVVWVVSPAESKTVKLSTRNFLGIIALELVD